MTFVKILIRAEDTERVLFQHGETTAGIANKNTWTAVGGETDDDEEPEDAALRIIEEETGTRLAHVRYLSSCLISATHADGRKSSVELRVYLGTLPQQTPLRARSGGELRWMTIDEYIALPSPDGYSAFLKKHANDILGRAAPELLDTPTAAKVFVRARDTGRFCFERRSRAAGKTYAGMLALLGGKLEDGESPEDGARREVTEESALALDELTLLEIITETVTFSDGRDAKEVTTAYYSATVASEDDAVASDESEGLEWRTLTAVEHQQPVPGLVAFIAKHRQALERQ